MSNRTDSSQRRQLVHHNTFQWLIEKQTNAGRTFNHVKTKCRTLKCYRVHSVIVLIILQLKRSGKNKYALAPIQTYAESLTQFNLYCTKSEQQLPQQSQKIKKLQYQKETQRSPCEKALGDSGKDKLPFDRQNPPAEPGSGRDRHPPCRSGEGNKLARRKTTGDVQGCTVHSVP